MLLKLGLVYLQAKRKALQPTSANWPCTEWGTGLKKIPSNQDYSLDRVEQLKQ